MSDRASDGFYVFVRDHRSVQFVQYRPSEHPIKLQKAVTTKSMALVPYGPYLRLE
ncbi:hypothetical protein [Nocardia sp. CA-145437]|uniref:hypothetical protein n=1 Tax=Nocardia sp. CA-145437 TaxID=3239980 RepID=UPI003D98C7C7